ncbi:MAG: shikimate kinase [Alicyclobacillus sp.]|nr:shikimate kinase [Alicyclobacillus sp.]
MVRLALVGMMGSGKSSVAQMLGTRLQIPYLDLDEEIERHTGTTIPKLFAEAGESGFRAAERAVLEDVTAAFRGRELILATGGGVVTDPSARALLRREFQTVWLQATVATLAQRVRAQALERPLLQQGEGTEQRLSELSRAREAMYCDAATFSVTVDGKTVGEVAEEIIRWVKRQTGK